MGNGLVVDESLMLPLLVIVLAAWIGPLVIVALQVKRIHAVLWVALLVITVLAGPFGIVPAGVAWLLGKAGRETTQPDDGALAMTAAIRRVPPRRRRG